MAENQMQRAKPTLFDACGYRKHNPGWLGRHMTDRTGGMGYHAAVRAENSVRVATAGRASSIGASAAMIFPASPTPVPPRSRGAGACWRSRGGLQSTPAVRSSAGWLRVPAGSGVACDRLCGA